MAQVRLTLPAAAIPDALYTSPGFLLAWLSDRLVGHYGSALADMGLRPAHHAVLLTLAELEPMRQARLREQLRIDHATFVTTVNALEQHRLLAREPHPTDRRTLVLRLTRDGHVLLQRIEATMRKIEDRELSVLGEHDRVHLTEALGTVVRHLSGASEQPPSDEAPRAVAS